MTVGRGRRRAARVVVLDPQDRLLLINARDPVRRDGPDWWEIPGGGIDPGETSLDAAQRELREEAGITGADIGPCIWTQTVEFTFGGWHFEQDEWVHVARCDGATVAPRALESLEAMAFGEQRWWTLDEVVGQLPRTIPYRLPEFLPDLLSGPWPEAPLDITPTAEQVLRWRAADVR